LWCLKEQVTGVGDDLLTAVLKQKLNVLVAELFRKLKVQCVLYHFTFVLHSAAV